MLEGKRVLEKVKTITHFYRKVMILINSINIKDLSKYCVYRFIDKNKKIIYIGYTEDIYTRMNGHFSSKNRLDKTGIYNEVKIVEYISMPSKTEAQFLEKYFISKFSPKYNSKGNLGDNETFLIEFKNDFEWKNFNLELFRTHPKLKEFSFYDKNMKNTYKMKRSLVKESELEEVYVLKRGDKFLSKNGKECTISRVKINKTFNDALRFLKKYDHRGDCRIVKIFYQEKEDFYLPLKYHNDIAKQKAIIN